MLVNIISALWICYNSHFFSFFSLLTYTSSSFFQFFLYIFSFIYIIYIIYISYTLLLFLSTIILFIAKCKKHTVWNKYSVFSRKSWVNAFTKEVRPDPLAPCIVVYPNETLKGFAGFILEHTWSCACGKVNSIHYYYYYFFLRSNKHINK